jgi:hypothetical protein
MPNRGGNARLASGRPLATAQLMWHLVPISAELVVDGQDDARGVGPFRGRVLAMALENGSDGGVVDATTWLLVADDAKPAPVWVGLDAVASQRLGR